jgi:hypothetical protein
MSKKFLLPEIKVFLGLNSGRRKYVGRLAGDFTVMVDIYRINIEHLEVI